MKVLVNIRLFNIYMKWNEFIGRKMFERTMQCFLFSKKMTRTCSDIVQNTSFNQPSIKKLLSFTLSEYHNELPKKAGFADMESQSNMMCSNLKIKLYIKNFKLNESYFVESRGRALTCNSFEQIETLVTITVSRNCLLQIDEKRAFASYRPQLAPYNDFCCSDCFTP